MNSGSFPEYASPRTAFEFTTTLDSFPDDFFLPITRLAACMLGVSAAFVACGEGSNATILSRVGDNRFSISPDLPFFALIPDTGEAVTIDDPEFEASPAREESGFLAAAAMRFSDGSITGVLVVADPEPRPFPFGDRSKLEELAALAGRQAELKSTERISASDRERELAFSRALLKLSHLKIQSLDDVAPVLRETTKTAATVLGTGRTGIWLYNEDRSAIRCLMLYDAESDRHEEGLELSATKYPEYFAALDEDRSIAADDARTDPRTRAFATGYLAPLNIFSMLDAPIRQAGQMIGVVCHEYLGGPHNWTEDERQFAASVADFVSLTLETQEVKQTEDALRKREKRYRKLFENANDLVYLHDLDGKFLAVNKTMEQALGYGREELIGTAIADLLPSDFLSGDGQPLDDELSSTSCVNYETEFRTKQGRRIPVEVNTRLVVEDGRPVAVQGIARNITERKRAEEQRLAGLRQLLEGIRVINSNLDLTTVLQAIVEESAALVKGEPGAIGLVEDDRLVFKRMWGKSGWEETNVTFRLGQGVAGKVAKTGKTVIVVDPTAEPDLPYPELINRYDVRGWMDVPIVSRDGRVGGVLDVRCPASRSAFTETDRELVEALANQAAMAIENASLYSRLAEQTEIITASMRELEKLYTNAQEVTRRLQELDRMKTNFLIVTSHEMRTPLTILRGYVDLLVDDFLGVLSTVQKPALETCRRMVDRMVVSFNNILEMLKINEGRVKFTLSQMDLGDSIRFVASELAVFLRQRAQRISLNLPERLTIIGDEEKIQLVLLNIIQNAIKFTPDGGGITVKVSAGEDGVHIVIADSGIGIEADEIDKVFEPFYTSKDPLVHTSGQFEFSARGSGLGLSVARSYVEALGGRIWVESEGKDQGSRFHVVLPIYCSAK